MDVQDISDYKTLKSVFLAKKGGEPVAYSVSKISFKNISEGLLALETIETREEADALIGNTLFISEDQLPKLDEGHFYYFEVIGFEIKDTKTGLLGTIENILDVPGGDIIVMRYQEKEVLIPMAFTRKVERESRILNVELPDGLVEAYLS